MEGFQQIMTNHSDEKLIEILRNKDKYQEVAVNAAMVEALNRKIIESEADLETKYPSTTINSTTNSIYTRYDDGARRKKANSDMLYGALWCVGGIVATAANIGFIFWGAILFGGIQFFRGLTNSQ